MEFWTQIITVFVGAVVSIATGWFAILPKMKELNGNNITSEQITNIVKEHSITKEQVEDILKGSDVLQELGESNKIIKKGIQSEMRRSLLAEYNSFMERGYDITEKEYKQWKDDFATYTALGGNGVIAECNHKVDYYYEMVQQNKDRPKVLKL